MIDVGELGTALEPSGCSVRREDRFFGFSSLTGSTYRLLCTSSRSAAVWPSDFSFWVHEGRGVSFLGLFNGLLYHLADAERTVALCRDLCSARSQFPPGPLTQLPHGIAETYGMRKVEMIVLADARAATWEEAMESKQRFPHTEQDFVQRIEGKVDSVHKDSTDLLYLRMGDCRAFTRLPETAGNVTTLSVVFEGGLRDTADEVRLLAALGTSFSLAMFDMAWGNRINIDDPYYGLPQGIDRPYHPMNAWEE